jgi:hypothetical protein
VRFFFKEKDSAAVPSFGTAACLYTGRQMPQVSQSTLVIVFSYIYDVGLMHILAMMFARIETATRTITNVEFKSKLQIVSVASRAGIPKFYVLHYIPGCYKVLLKRPALLADRVSL